MILVIKGYKFKVSHKKDEEKSKSQPEKTIAERVKLRRHEADDQDLTDIPSLQSYKNYDTSDEFIDIPDMPPPAGDKEQGKRLKILTSNKLLTRLPQGIFQTCIAFDYRLLPPFAKIIKSSVLMQNTWKRDEIGVG